MLVKKGAKISCRSALLPGAHSHALPGFGRDCASRHFARWNRPRCPARSSASPRRRCGTRLPVRRPFRPRLSFSATLAPLSRRRCVARPRRGGSATRCSGARRTISRAACSMLQTASRRRRRRLCARCASTLAEARSGAPCATGAVSTCAPTSRTWTRPRSRSRSSSRSAARGMSCAAAFVAASSSLAPRATCARCTSAGRVRAPQSHLSPHAEPLLKLPSTTTTSIAAARSGSGHRTSARGARSRRERARAPSSTAYSGSLTRGMAADKGQATPTLRRHRRPRRRQPRWGGAAEGRAAPAATSVSLERGATPPRRGLSRRRRRSGGRSLRLRCSRRDEGGDGHGDPRRTPPKEGTSACGRDSNLCATSSTTSLESSTE